MKNPTFEIRYFDIGAPIFVRPQEQPYPSLIAIAFVVLAIGIAYGANAWFEGLCPNGGTILLSTGIACAL